MSGYLYERLNNEFVRGHIEDKGYPKFIDENLNDFIILRDYQKNIFSTFNYYYENVEAKGRPLHLAFQMATGSGKTLIMAGLILYLYEKGYRNFLFFVNRTQIVEKSRQNFLKKGSKKCLFKENIMINHKNVLIKEVENFSQNDEGSINMCFNTIQGLHRDLMTIKENGLTIQDFKDKKIVLISDEAHHINVATKSQSSKNNEEEKSWEFMINKILNASGKNIMLEFSATFDLKDVNVRAKYKDKILTNYDLKSFVSDRFSKDIYLLQTNFETNKRIMCALVLNMHRSLVAQKYRLNINPIILFKSHTIKESQINKKEFHNIIDSLYIRDIENLKGAKNLGESFEFFKSINMGLGDIVNLIKERFRQEHTLSTNDEEVGNQQQILNSLEYSHIRAIFSVDKLNEGWDVLNLFDIVRLYRTRSKVATISEAQLIGRGARYYPFEYGDENKFKRKFDSDIKNELRILETLYYHSEDDSKYISELKNELRKMGLIEQKEPEKITMKIKDHLQEKLRNQIVFKNQKVPNTKNSIDFSTFKLAKSNLEFIICSSDKIERVLDDNIDSKIISESGGNNESSKMKKRTYDFYDFFIKNTIRNAMLDDEFYDFDNLKEHLKDIESSSEFMEKLRIFKIDVIGEFAKNAKNNRYEMEKKYAFAQEFLTYLKEEIKVNFVEFEGTQEFKKYPFNSIFTDKTLIMIKGNEKYEITDPWFVYDKFSANSYEKKLVDLMREYMDRLIEKYKKDEIYLVRNERQLAIYSFESGARFEPDFLLFLKDESFGYQVFIEAKGEHLKEKEKWKEEFLKQLQDKAVAKEKSLIENEAFRIIGIKFYSDETKNDFKSDFENKILKSFRI